MSRNILVTWRYLYFILYPCYVIFFIWVTVRENPIQPLIIHSRILCTFFFIFSFEYEQMKFTVCIEKINMNFSVVHE